MPCPNKNLQIWKNLVEAVGDVNAQWAFNLNQFDIPTVEQAILLLDAQKQQDETTSNPKTNRLEILK